ncbi:hypothetical protein HMPREF9533_01606 [Escherichia coli MS 60-1]|nr:hypothetical protein HMPREF9533_01606 [Escherichia coli MS 60-1]
MRARVIKKGGCMDDALLITQGTLSFRDWKLSNHGRKIEKAGNNGN